MDMLYQKLLLGTTTPLWSTGLVSPLYAIITDTPVKTGCSDVLGSCESPGSCSDFLSDISTSRSPDSGRNCISSISDFVPEDVLDFVADYSARRSEADTEFVYDDLTDANPTSYLPQPTDFHLPDVLAESGNTDCLESDSYPRDLIMSKVRRNVHSKRRREINREASKRYRQRLKQKSLKTQQDLSLVISAYEQSKSAYEKAEHAFDVLKNIVLDLINIVPRN
ncbi:unnamed protein product [Schistosoma rodhaini]|uniref:BZIP domain-containing protein n=1 Tax=Schistosoma rodhaini TaxID=6188 RepID=A0A183RHJ4_9TREM|nr:unnamed protein product [Schistosoma rodhaini]